MSSGLKSDLDILGMCEGRVIALQEGKEMKLERDQPVRQRHTEEEGWKKYEKKKTKPNEDVLDCINKIDAEHKDINKHVG